MHIRHSQKTHTHLKQRHRSTLWFLGVGVVIAVCLLSAYKLWEAPPSIRKGTEFAILSASDRAEATPEAIAEMAPETSPAAASAPMPEATPAPTPAPTPTPAPEATPEPLPEGVPLPTERQDGIYTILLAGLDEAANNTDSIMVCRLDTNSHSLNVVSIPRDTIINVDWDVRRINSVYAGSLNTGGNGVNDLLMHIRFFTGFEPDAYAVVSLDTFIDVIDTMGGVWFDVPFAMDYEQYYDGLFIHLQPGYQKLDGYQCMGLCRFRSDYSNADLGRIDMQHAFFKAAAEQFLTLGNIPNAAKAIAVAAEGINTNLSAANIAWLARQVLQCRSEDIRFYSMPGDAVLIRDTSYFLPAISLWLQMINDDLNPYAEPVTYGMLNMVYRDAEGYKSTRELNGAWYYEPEMPAVTLPADAEPLFVPSEEPAAGIAPESEPQDEPAEAAQQEAILPPDAPPEAGPTWR